jgi:hypothetical protein
MPGALAADGAGAAQLFAATSGKAITRRDRAFDDTKRNLAEFRAPHQAFAVCALTDWIFCSISA